MAGAGCFLSVCVPPDIFSPEQVGANEQVVPSRSGSVDTFPWFGNQNGTYQIMASLSSKVLGNSRNVIVYTPPSYLENTVKRYANVIIMHDGQNLFNDSTSFAGQAWNIQNTIDSMTVQGQQEEVIVVGLYNTPNRDNEYTYSRDPSEGFGGQGEQYIEWIERTVLPWVRGNLRVNVTRYGMIGSSLGGLISCYAGWTRPSVWGRTGCMSSSFWWNNQDFNATILKTAQPPTYKLFYIDTGTDEGSSPPTQVQQTKTVVTSIVSKGWTLDQRIFFYLDDGGQHNEYFWGRRFPVVMSAMYPKQQCVLN